MDDREKRWVVMEQSSVVPEVGKRTSHELKGCLSSEAGRRDERPDVDIDEFEHKSAL